MKVLIVHAHHEPKSFSSALYQQAVETLSSVGHEVATSELYALGFDPVSDRRNFTTVADPDYLKQQVEEKVATEQNGFAPALEAEIAKLEACDLLIFSFPLWWFGLPGILKGWVDRVFPMHRIYGNGKFYENGLGKAQKRAMVIMTTGGSQEAYGGFGVQPPLSSVLSPIEHGVFWFNGFLPLDAFVAYSAARISQEERAALLQQLDQRLRALEGESPRRLAAMGEFAGGFGLDTKKRFMAVASRRKAFDEGYRSQIPAERARLAEMRREGVLLSSYIGLPDAEPWHVFLQFRESSEERVREHLDTLPLRSYLDFSVTELMMM
ncbi:MAG TPA: NAD(P)H-dependent oxidoreductase [Acidisarcina sp.]